MKYSLEICVGSVASALTAQANGADRIELCDNLSEGGTTPSFGIIKTCVSLLTIPVFPIIRPRGGDFVYSDQEFEAMKQDMLCCLELGCQGVVFGILEPNGSIDKERCSELVSLSGSMQLTFHRAFDRCSDREIGLEEVISMGFHRVLTSGGEDNAEDAVPELERLVKQAKNRISIMPGSGINSQNLLKIVGGTGAHEFHTTAKKKIDPIGDDNYQSSMDTQYYQTDGVKVREMRGLLNSLS